MRHWSRHTGRRRLGGAHGKFAAAFCHSGERANELARRGFALCSVASDQLLLRLAARQELAKARAKPPA